MESSQCCVSDLEASDLAPPRECFGAKGMMPHSRSKASSRGAVLVRVALLCALLLPARAALAAPGLIREQLSDDVWLIRAPSELDLWTSSNSLVIVNSDDVTVFDNNARPGTTRLLIAEIRKLTPKPV